MTKVISINERGTLTLPKQLRRRLGIGGEGQVLAEEREEGILLKAGVTFPLEGYSDARIAEFKKNNEDVLKKYFQKKR